MKKSLLEISVNSILTILILALFSILKLMVGNYEWQGMIRVPLIWLYSAAAIVFMISIGMFGIIENKTDPSESEETIYKYRSLEKRYEKILAWGILVPAILGTALVFYIIAPTSWSMFLLVVFAAFIGNTARYFFSNWKSNRVS